MSFVDSWFAFRVLNGRELNTARHLREQGIRATLPVQLRQKRVHRRTKRKSVFRVPVIPGYVFVSLPVWLEKGSSRVSFDEKHLAAIWHGVLHHGDVRGVLGSNGFPVQIRTAQLERLLHNRAAGIFRDEDVHDRVIEIDETAEFSPGEIVEIDMPGFEWMKTQILSIHGREAAVLLDLFGSERRVLVSFDKLVKKKCA